MCPKLEFAPQYGTLTIRRTSRQLKLFNVVKHVLLPIHMIAILVSQLQWENL